MLLSSMDREQVTCLKAPALVRSPCRPCGRTASIPQAHLGPSCVKARPCWAQLSLPLIQRCFL